ncbi:MAG: hypothetical protein LBB04_03645 [Oscillospiraceae bacterium]|jgi:hypothetical protein|nr:hypothetical protein [Oscillospiraceae bacterium]
MFFVTIGNIRGKVDLSDLKLCYIGVNIAVSRESEMCRVVGCEKGRGDRVMVPLFSRWYNT